MEIKRLLTNLCSNDLGASKAFYTGLFDFGVEYDSDWFVQLKSPGKAFELGIIAQDHNIVPERISGEASDTYLTFVVEDVDRFYELAKTLNVYIEQPPQPTPYGQKSMLLVAPEGTICDVCSPMKEAPQG